MYLKEPLFFKELKSLREQIPELEKQEGGRAALWKLLRNSARTAPESFPWYTPFVAVVTGEKEDRERAKRVIRLYLQKLQPMRYLSGLQFHFWCFAFPHAKWALYFQWLCSDGVFTPEERKEMEEQFISCSFLNFYYGMNTKPDPECVDNQTLSLALSCALVGYIFKTDGESKLAEIMYRDGMRRLPGIIGAMPVSGYSGEGSTYMDCVNGPAIPLAVELLTQVTGDRDVFNTPFEPNGTKPCKVLEMIAREWMPGGLLLPWDSYGYQYGTRSAVSYAAKKTGAGEYLDILEHKCVWTYDVGIGWAYDDLVWTMAWWPEHTDQKKEKKWFDKQVGGILESEDSERYLMQMWDDSGVGMPARMHMNPNAVILNGYKTPLSADGTKKDGMRTRFEFPDAYREVGNLTIGETTRYNFGDACAGGHSVLIVDGNESMRVISELPQSLNAGADFSEASVQAEVTPVYQAIWPDIKKVVRKSRMHQDTFFTVEDLFLAETEHEVAARFLLRPDFAETKRGVKIETPEGVTLHLFDLCGEPAVRKEEAAYYPKQPDGHCVIADFCEKGRVIRHLFAAFISRTRRMEEYETDFACIADPDRRMEYKEAAERLKTPDAVVPLRLPAYMEAEVPAAGRFWYRKKIEKRPGEAWLVLPRGLIDPVLFIDGQEMDLSRFEVSKTLMPSHVKLPADLNEKTSFEFLFRVDVTTSHYETNENGMTVSVNGGVALCYPCEEETVETAEYDGREIRIVTNQNEYRSEYRLMQEDDYVCI